MAIKDMSDEVLYQILMSLGRELSMVTEEEDARRIYDERDAIEAEITHRAIEVKDA